MKRRAFILTEILTGMVIQAGFVLVLFGAFYLLLSFSTSTQQILAAHDEGQMVISYIDSRIRNAGLGLWNCGSPSGIAAAFDWSHNFSAAKGDLPVAVLKNTKTISKSNDDTIDKDSSRSSKVYCGNVLTLLYAHKDTKDDGGKLFVYSSDYHVNLQGANGSDRKAFQFIQHSGSSGKLDSNFDFTWNKTDANKRYCNLKSWAVMESCGFPVRVSDYEEVEVTVHASPKDYTAKKWMFKMNAPYKSAVIHSMSELLSLECERLYVDVSPSTGERCFMISSLEGLNGNGTSAVWNTALPHTQGILELYMELDVRKTIPIFTLWVLVSEGIRDDSQTTPRPSNWPSSAVWNTTYSSHKVHVSQATWALYNLEPLTY